MSDDASDLIISGALLAGAGVVGYFGARWLSAAPTTAAPIAAVPTSHAPAAILPRAPRPAAPPSRAPTRSTAAADRAGPVTSPDQVADDAGPVTSPAQVDAATAAPPGKLPRTFDPIFERYRAELPIEYLRALAMRESGMNPRASDGPARGLLQITEIVRADFNRTHHTAITRAQLLDPDTNVRIATWLLRFIVDGYARHHADVANMRPDWNNPRFAELVTFGWNAGPSEAGGVGRVVGYLKRKGAREIDLDLVHEHARAAGAHAHLSNPAKARWSRGVVALYQRERAQPTTAPVA
jgi:soluble lytic murein transglycosylase-like protein